MNFVIFARNFYPQNNPEAYCSTRFASALAATGHSVHVVTAEYPEVAEDDPYRKLVHTAMKITRVKAERRMVGNRSGRLGRLMDIDLIHLTVEDWDSHNIGKFTAATKAVLAKYDSPVLITRTYPMTSLYVGWRCRRHAAKWIAHFSDPILDYGYGSLIGRLKRRLLLFWMRRAFKYADGISVTCKRVMKYYREELGKCVDGARWILALHVGDDVYYRPSPAEERMPGVIVHDGDIYYGRGLQIVDAVERLNAKGVKCEFIQKRKMREGDDRRRIEKSPYCAIVEAESSAAAKCFSTEVQRHGGTQSDFGCASERAKRAAISFVADFNWPGERSMWLMSKFVYQVYEDLPIVVLSKKESEKHDFCQRYPEAGLFFADMNEPESLDRAIELAMKCDPSKIDRTRIRKEFTAEKIAADFIEQLTEPDIVRQHHEWMRLPR